MESKFYAVTDGGRFDATRLKLCLFDEKSLHDIVDLINYRGRAIVSDIHGNSTEADPPHLMGIMGPEYVRYSDVPGLIGGLATLLLAQLRKVKYGPDEYTTILKDAFALPELLARKYANEIESYDAIISDANRDGDASLSETVTQYKNLIEEGLRRVVNGLAATAGMGTVVNWDQSQTYDIDFLDELSSLGEIVGKLNRRNRLMTAQAVLNQSLNAFQTGDVEEGDVVPCEEVVGDVFSALGKKQLPATLLGNWGNLTRTANAATMQMGKALVDTAGIAVSPTTKEPVSHPVGPKGAKIKAAIQKVLAGKPSHAALIGALAGIASGLLAKTPANVAVKLARRGAGSQVGDVDRLALYGDIADYYGPEIADAWLAGDVESVVKTALEDSDSINTGDVDPDILQSAADALATGDSDESLDPEIGGIITRWKTNAAIRRAERTVGRQARKGARLSAKNELRAQRAAAIRKRKAASISDTALEEDASYPTEADDYSLSHIPAPMQGGSNEVTDGFLDDFTPDDFLAE